MSRLVDIMGALEAEQAERFDGATRGEPREVADMLANQAVDAAGIEMMELAVFLRYVEALTQRNDGVLNPVPSAAIMGLIVGARLARAAADNERVGAKS